MENLVIDRGQWLTGTAVKMLDGGSLCHRTSGLMCCLGFYGLSCGFTPESMNGGGTLTGKFLSSAVPDWLMKKLDSKDGKRFHKTGADVENALAELNDKERGIHPSRRESAIAYLFKKYGDVNVTFTGKYAVATKKANDYIKDGQ